MKILRAEFQKLRTSSLARNAGWMFLGQGLNLLLQAAYFILLAHLLGVRQYGIFAGAFAFVSIAAPYSALGSGLVFLRYVSTNPKNHSVYWGNVIFATIVMGSFLTLLLRIVAPHLLNQESAAVILLVALGECICRQLAICIGQMFQAFEQLRMTAAMNLLTSLLRLLAVLGLSATLHHATAWQWAFASLVVSTLAAAAGSAMISVSHGWPRFAPRLFVSRFSEGLNFSLAGSTQSVYNDIDKTLLSHYGMNVANGIYTMAYRVVDVATIPVTALDAAALPRYFRQSGEGGNSVRNLALRLAGRAALLGLVTAVCMFLAAPLIPLVIGKGFAESVLALRWLSLLPAFRGIHQLTGSAVTGLGFQRYRTRGQIAAAVFNLGLNLWLIPRYGWHGAAWTSLATDGGLAIVNLFLLQSLQHRTPETSATTIQ
jgi:O-antigen/teichoic acid export membrane protein